MHINCRADVHVVYFEGAKRWGNANVGWFAIPPGSQRAERETRRIRCKVDGSPRPGVEVMDRRVVVVVTVHRQVLVGRRAWVVRLVTGRLHRRKASPRIRTERSRR